MTADLIARARAGDGDAFRELTEPHLGELQVHCYRMLGSFQDAEDALQNTLLTAWQSLGGFEGRASLRTWLYRIATHRCLDARRAASRRLAKGDLPGVEPPEPTRLGEVVWLQPFPDALLEGAIDGPPGPEARYEQTESISLAFVTALQVLPPRRLAVLILRDVLGFRASEVACDAGPPTVESVSCSALKRARASLQRRPASRHAGHEPPPGQAHPPRRCSWRSSSARGSRPIWAAAGGAANRRRVHIDTPPMPFGYEGRDVVARFCTGLFGVAGGSTSCRHEPTANAWHSAPTCARPGRHPQRDLAYTCSLSPATESAP